MGAGPPDDACPKSESDDSPIVLPVIDALWRESLNDVQRPGSNKNHDLSATQAPPRAESTKKQDLKDENLPSVPTITMSSSSSIHTHHTENTLATSVADLGPLQAKTELDNFEPLEGDDPASYDLVAPPTQAESGGYSLKKRSVQLLSREHLKVIFSDPSYLLKFTSFLSKNRPQSVQVLIYYLDAVKALKAIAYANAIAEALEPLSGQSFTNVKSTPTVNKVVEHKASAAFDAMVQEDLPAFVTHVYIRLVSESITQRITGTLAPHLREASEGLAEVFCLTDPARPDNPIVFASEEFHRTTQYGMDYAIGRNCRFLQGPQTNPHSVRRLREACEKGQEHCEVFLNYRRDGSQFLNLLMIAPLCDSRGRTRYFIGAQVDVSGLAKDCTDMETLEKVLIDEQREAQKSNGVQTHDTTPYKDEFQELSEILNMSELETVRRWGGRMHSEAEDNNDIMSNSASHASNRPRLLLKENSSGEEDGDRLAAAPRLPASGKLSGVYKNYLLIRPHPSLRILFASPSLRVPGILQSPFLSRIGGSQRVRDELSAALGEGRGVTAKIKWITRFDEDGRGRWIHCTPLIGSNGHIGVWMVVLVDMEGEGPRRAFKTAPPVLRDIGDGNGRVVGRMKSAEVFGTRSVESFGIGERMPTRDGRERMPTRDGHERMPTREKATLESQRVGLSGQRNWDQASQRTGSLHSVGL